MLNVVMQCLHDECRCADCRAERGNVRVITMSVIMLNVVMLIVAGPDGQRKRWEKKIIGL